MTIALLLAALACGGPSSSAPESTSSSTDDAEQAAGPEGKGTEAQGAERSDVKAPGNLPVRTRAELASEADARQSCLDTCEKERAMEASPIETIRASCARKCDQEHPMEQVEVSDGPLGLPPG